MSEQPSIAVLPFNNMSGDPEQEYFSDGITEDIITDLSKVGGLLVIARNSSFAYKGKSFDIRTVGRELGVRSVLEGSIRRAGNRVRITAQLIDAASGGHVWADRYDRDLTDIFAVQDEVTEQIVAALKISLTPSEKASMTGSGTTNLEAHDLFLRGREIAIAPTKNRQTFEQAVTLLKRAIELDPGYAEAYAALAMTYNLDFHNRWTEDPDKSLEIAARLAGEAIEKGPNEPFGHYVQSVIASFKNDLPRATAESEKALAINPNYAQAHSSRGIIDIYNGEPMLGIPRLERSMRLDPAFAHQYIHFVGLAYLVAGKYEAAAAQFKERILLSPQTDLSRAFYASTLGHLGQPDEARRIWHELKEINPKYDFEGHIGRLPFRKPEDVARIREGLTKAGLPD
jgi:adenylate cyclase